MDDVRIGDEMTLEGIGKQLEAIRADVAAVKNDMAGVKADIAGVKAEMAGVKTEMTGVKTEIAGVKTEIAGVNTEIASVNTEIADVRAGVNGDVGGLRAEMKAGFNASKIRDEELRDLMKFGLEAREALRESVTTRFDATDKKHDEEIGLLKDVLRAVRAERG